MSELVSIAFAGSVILYCLVNIIVALALPKANQFFAHLTSLTITLGFSMLSGLMLSEGLISVKFLWTIAGIITFGIMTCRMARRMLSGIPCVVYLICFIYAIGYGFLYETVI